MVIKNKEDTEAVKIGNLSRPLVAALAWSAALSFALILAVAVGVAQEPADQTLQIGRTLVPQAPQPGEPALATLTVRNPSDRTVTVAGLTAQLGAGLAYVGQAAGSDVAQAAQVTGTRLVWPGPFAVAASETLTIRYWVVNDRAVAEPGLGESSPTRQPAAPGANGTISAVKTAEPSVLEPGSPVAYTVVFSNNTTSDTALEVITDTLPVPFQYVGLAVGSDVTLEAVDTDEPDIVWRGAFTVPAESTLTLRYWAWVLGETRPGTTPYTNTVTAAYSDTLVGPAEAPVTVVAPYVRPTKDAWPLEVDAASPVTYTVVLKNEGNAQGVVDSISDTLPAGFTFLNMVAGGTITTPPAGVAGTIVWSGPYTMPVGSAITLTYQARASLASGSAMATNQVVAQVNGQVTDPAEATVEVQPLYLSLPLVVKKYVFPYFTATKVASTAEVFEGEYVTYTVTLVNGGSEAGIIDQIQDVLPAGFTFQNMVSGGDVLAPPAGTVGTIVWNGPFTVASKDSLTLIYRVKVSDVAGTYENSVTATTRKGLPPKEPANASVVVKEPFLLIEDFESGTDGWEPFLNYWRLHPEQWYLQAGAGYGGSTGLRHSYFLGVSDPDRGAHDALYIYRGTGAEHWTNYRVEAWTRMDDGVSMGLWVRAKYIPDPDDGLHVEGYYVSWIARNRNSVGLDRLRTTGSTAYHFSDPENLVTVDREMHKNTWYRMAVEVRGSNIKVFIDGDLVIDYNDSTFAEGSVGFVCYKVGYGTWDDIVVTPLD
jgi:uncharacterized repeat protein (TIGR01451 family)